MNVESFWIVVMMIRAFESSSCFFRTAVDVFELNPGFALVDAVDGEPHRGDVAGRYDALDGGAFGGRHPLLPGGGDVVEFDARGLFCLLLVSKLVIYVIFRVHECSRAA